MVATSQANVPVVPGVPPPPPPFVPGIPGPIPGPGTPPNPPLPIEPPPPNPFDPLPITPPKEPPPPPPPVPLVPNSPIYDPNLPVYAAPTGLEDPNAGITQNPVNSYIDPNQATVEGRTAGILASGNQLTELAKADNARDYQASGLLNSANAVAGGTLASMREARAIATPDAALYGDMSKMQQKTDQDAALNNQVASLENQANKNSASLSASLTTHEQGGQAELQKAVDAAQLQRVEFDNMWKQQINYDQMDAADRTALLGVSQTIGAELTGGIERVMRDTNIEDKEAAIASLMTTYQSQMTTAASIVGLELTWD